MSHDLLCLVTVVYVFGPDRILTVDNGFNAGDWQFVDECPSGSYAGGIQLKVKYVTLFWYATPRHEIRYTQCTQMLNVCGELGCRYLFHK